MDSDILFRHDKVRPEQEALVSDIHAALSEKKHIVAHAPTGLGKCIAGDSLIFSVDGLEEAKNLEEGVLNVIDESIEKLALRKGKKVKYTTEKILRITTRHGYSIKTTLSHKMLTQKGWINAEELTIGQKVATTRKWHIKTKKLSSFKLESKLIRKNISIRITPKIAYFMGAFAGDGSYNSKIRVRFTLKSQEIVAKLEEALAEMSLGFKRYKDSNYHVDSIVLKKFLETYGCPDIRTGKKGGKCEAIFIPNKIITASKDIFCAYLQGLFDTDGYIEKTGVVAITSKSQKLITTLKFSLLRLGIISQTALKRNLKYGSYHILRITDRLSLKSFHNNIDFNVKYKKERLFDHVKKISITNANPNIDTFEIDKETLVEIRKCVHWKDKLYDLLCEYIVGNKKITKVAIKRLIYYLSKNGSVLHLDYLNKLYNSDILWDEVIRIEEIEKEEVFDFYVEDHHNFIANGFVVHNSDASLGAALSYALKNDLTIFFLTPKISQHRIAIEVIRGIAKKYSLPIRAVDMIGRRYACIDSSLSDLDQDAFYQACQKKRKKEECRYYGNAKGYSKVQEAKANHQFGKVLSEYGAARTHDELIGLGETHASCPYEWMIKLASQSNVIVADYFQLLVPSVRDVFLQKIKKKIENSIIIIDEAHNLPKRVRDQLSSVANSFTFKKIEGELKLFEDQNFRAQMGFDKWAHLLLKGEREKLVFKHEFNEFLSAFNYTIEDLADYLESVGEEFIEKTNKKSACLKLSKFIRAWQVEERSSIRILKNKGTYFSLSKRYLDSAVATDILNTAYATVAMSGTLLPLDMHRDLLGLDPARTVLKKYSSPFDVTRTINIIAKGTTTRYTSRTIDNYKIMAGKIDSIAGVTPGGTALFFPSYAVMNNTLPLLKIAPLLIQKENMNPHDTHDLVRRFTNKEGVLCAVQGGSLSEGLDYSQGQIKTAVIVGVALEEMSLEIESLIDYYQEKYGKGWEYGYTYPAIIKALQAAGRGVRKESDRCALVFMDERFSWKNYQSAFDGRRFVFTDEPEKYVQEFWKEG